MNNNLAFVLGASRSGTTWLAKIIDSHPDVLYRHEPDIPQTGPSLPLFCRQDEVARHVDIAKASLRRYAHTRHVRATGVRPYFRKNYLSGLQAQTRESLIYCLRALERLPIGELAYRLAIPDFTSLDGALPLCLIKSVSSLGRINLLLQSHPGAKFIIIIRHPCGYVASRLRQPKVSSDWKSVGAGLPQAEQAERRGIGSAEIDAMSVLERLAWVWTIFNEKALEDCAANQRVKVLRYEDLCIAPAQQARQVLDFLGLDWQPQTEQFVSASTTQEKESSDYYSIVRDTSRELEKWRNQLEHAQIQTIRSIVEDSLPGKLFLEGSDPLTQSESRTS
ncbi:MAG: sulfotransferase [Pseudomonadota bacterium]